jgi:NhaP-type Na+/H+ or K+/H+ antiporter
MDTTEVTIALGTIVVFGVSAMWLGRKTGIPSIVLLLLAGIVAGPVTGLVDPDALLGDTLDPAVTLAVGLLLFDSGFSLQFRRLTEGRAVVLRLVSVGVLVTWAVGSAAAYLIFDIPGKVALLLGAVLVVSGPTVVGPILQAARPRPRTAQILEWEGTLLDPIGATLGIVVLTVITSETRPGAGLILPALTAATGIGIGVACAAVLILAVRNFAMPDDLQVPVAFMFAVLAFTAANVLFAEAGLFATLTMGLVLANQRLAYVARIRRFQASIGTLIIATLFIVLAATIELSALQSVLLPSTGLLAVLVLVARPLATLAATLRSTVSGRERAFIASVAPRGIVAASTVSFYAISLDQAGLAADDIVPITFAIIIGAGIVYGFGSPAMARLLGVGQGIAKGVAFFMPVEAAHPVASELAGNGVPTLVVDAGRTREPDHEPLPYTLINTGTESRDMTDALEEHNIGTAVIGTGLGERDMVAMEIVGSAIGAKNVYLIPTATQAATNGIESLWRAQTPARRIAFGPDMTRSKLRDLAEAGDVLRWYPLADGATAIPPGTKPLFIVTGDGRGIIANQSTLDRARGRHRDPDTRVLCITPASNGVGDPHLSGWEDGLK